MDKRTKNPIVIGALTIVSVIVFFAMLYYLLGNHVLKGGTNVIVLMPDGAGLKRADRVQYQGVEVGSVKSIDLNPKGGVVVKLRLNKGLPLSSDSKVTVSGDVFGAHTVAVMNGKSLMQLQSGDTIRGSTTPLLTDLATNLSGRAETLLTSLDSLVAPSTVRDLRTTAAALPASAAQLNALLTEVRAASVSLRQSMLELEHAKAGPAIGSAAHQVDESAAAIKRASDNIAAASATLNTSLDSFRSIVAKIDGGRGTLGKMINDSSLYVETNEAMREIRALAQDIRERPGRYIDLRLFGKRDQ
jgi:phospholipid/cholesterol/gamma-HCH transport system substrate-binding protein